MSSSPEPTQDFQREFLCSICGNFFTNPVSIQCGHSFCQYCLLKSWQEDSIPFSCLECKRVPPLREFKNNKRLGKLAAIAKKLGLHPPQDPEDRRKCKEHQKVKTLFCEDDQRPICVACSQTQEHEAHKLCSLEEAAKNLREKLQKKATELRKKAKDVVVQISKEKMRLEVLKKQREDHRNDFLFQLQKMETFLEEEKYFHLSCLQTWGAVSSEGLRKRISGLCHQKQELKMRITELQEERERRDLDLLRDMKGILSRNKCVLQKKIEAFNIYLTMPPISEVIEWISRWKVDIILDCSTADPGLIIDENLKTVKYGEIQRKESNIYERLKDFAKVFGAQSFTSGRCYWEVEVPEIMNWCVGIYQNFNGSQNFFVLSSTQIHNSLCLYAMAQHNLYSRMHIKYRQVNIPNLKVGIFLDYERAEISFYDATHGYLIYTFPSVSFLGPFLPLFCLPKKKCSLTICP